jgi:hypothetical protein
MAKSNPAHSPAIAIGITAGADDKVFWHELDGVIGNIAQSKEMRNLPATAVSLRTKTQASSIQKPVWT